MPEAIAGKKLGGKKMEADSGALIGYFCHPFFCQKKLPAPIVEDGIESLMIVVIVDAQIVFTDIAMQAFRQIFHGWWPVFRTRVMA